MSLNKNCGLWTNCPGWTSAFKAMALLMVAFAAISFSSTVLAQGVHGITFLKGCQSPTEIGGPYLCRYGIANVGGDTGDGSPDSVDTVTFHSLTDVTHAGVDVPSGEILPLLLLSGEGGATCDIPLPGTGATVCTLPPGAVILTDFYSYYTAQLGDPDPLSDTATLLWNDTCDSGANNCPLGEQSTTSSSQSTLTCSDCDDSNACTADSCDELTNECVNTPDVDCDDSNACTADSCDPATGDCINTPDVDCDDNNACTADSCDPATGDCINTPDVDCDDSNACTADSCDPATGLCINTPDVDCDDNNACTDDSCDPATGECINDDNIICDDLNACTDDFCDPLTGQCVSVDNGESCEPIPTLSVGGLIAMILALMGLGGILMRRNLLTRQR